LRRKTNSATSAPVSLSESAFLGIPSLRTIRVSFPVRYTVAQTFYPSATGVFSREEICGPGLIVRPTTYRLRCLLVPLQTAPFLSNSSPLYLESLRHPIPFTMQHPLPYFPPFPGSFSVGAILTLRPRFSEPSQRSFSAARPPFTGPRATVT